MITTKINDLSIAAEKYINLAREESFKSPVLMKHGCVAVINGRVMARGHNHYRTQSSDGYIKNSCTCHAEMDTLRTLNKKTIMKKGRGGEINNKKVVLYIVRTDHKGELKESGPCIDCLTQILKLNIKKIIYSCNNNSVIISKPKDYTPVHLSLGRRYISRLLLL